MRPRVLVYAYIQLTLITGRMTMKVCVMLWVKPAGKSFGLNAVTCGQAVGPSGHSFNGAVWNEAQNSQINDRKMHRHRQTRSFVNHEFAWDGT